MRQVLRRVAIQLYTRAVRTPSAQERADRVLLIRPDHLGDVLLAAPAIASLRESAPLAHLTYLVGPWSLDVARRSSAVDELLTCPFPGFERAPRRNKLWPYLLLRREAARLHGRFDLAVVLRPDHWWGALLAATAHIPVRLGYDTPETRPLLTHALALPSRIHSVEQNARLVSAASELMGGQIPAPPSLRPGSVSIDEADRAWARSKLSNLDPTRPIVLLHPGSGSKLKAWPADRWVSVADRLAEDGNQIVLSGGESELALVESIQQMMAGPSLNLAGQSRLGQLAAVLARCTLAVGTDSGPLHLAAGLGIATVRLYGPSDPAIFGPPPAGHSALTSVLPCRPCGNLVAPPCGAHAEPPCMLGIQPEQVVGATRQLQLAPSEAASRS